MAACPAGAQSLRVATFNTELARDGPGLFLRDILKGGAADIEEAARRIAAAQPDVILLQGIDHDHGQVALAAFADLVADLGAELPHRFALAPNTGVPTGRDIDGDGRLGGPRDAQGYGEFPGQGGLAILSRHPVTGFRDFSGFLWADLPETRIADDDPARDVQRLSTTGHWQVTVATPEFGEVAFLAFHATPPVFDGPEDRNGRRNHDETAFWLHYLDGAIGPEPPGSGFVLLGDANLDPEDGEGDARALRALLADDRLQDPGPTAGASGPLAEAGIGANARHVGPHAMDTANWRDVPGPGNLRVDYVLPSADWSVAGSGILWPDLPPESGERISRHGLVWVDLAR